MAQTTVQDSNSIRFGSGVLEVGDTVGTLVNLGAMRGIEFEESWEVTKIMSDNAGEILRRIKDHVASVSGELMEINLTNLALLRGGLDTYAPVAAEEVTVTAESITLYDTEAVRLANKQGDGTECSTIVVAGGYARNTDYVVAVDPAGYTTIARIAAGGISDGATVSVGYKYTPNASKTLSTGGLSTIAPKVVRITNYDEAGKKFEITVYKASNDQGIKLTLPEDDSDDPALVPIKLVGSLDTTRTAGDQLFVIVDEQGA